jgi:hypothetical protein
MADEMDCEIHFFDLIRQKSPQMQPWLFATHEWFWLRAKLPDEVGLASSSQMKKLYPALTWEESMGAMLLYAEELRTTICHTYKGGKPPRVLPTALALGWIRNMINRGQFPDLAPGSFYQGFFADHLHPSADAIHGGGANGSYLVNLTWYGAFYRHSPEGRVLPLGTTFTPQQAILVQGLAWDVIKNYPDCGLYEEGTAPVGKPQFSPPPAKINGITQVTLTSSTPGAWFRYTLDGTQPTRTRGYVYCGVVSVRPGMTLKAIAYRSGMADSNVAEATFPAQRSSP